jgi:hypothetical protein
MKIKLFAFVCLSLALSSTTGFAASNPVVDALNVEGA